jgi:hypothetical protein
MIDGSENPVAALTMIAAPAVLTNACSLLVLTISNRFARAVDRTRELSGRLSNGGDPEALAAAWERQLSVTQRRALLLLRCLTAVYASVGSFAAGCLASLVGIALSAIGRPAPAFAVQSAGLVFTAVGVGSLVVGSAMLIREARLAFRNLLDESAACLTNRPPSPP